MAKVVRNTLIYTLGNILPQAVALILLPIYTEYLSPEQYGVVNSMLVIQSLLAIFFSLTLERSVLRLFWDYQLDGGKKFLGTISITITVTALFGVLITFMSQKYLSLLFMDIPFYPYFNYTIILTFLLTFSLVPKYYYRLTNQATVFLLISILELIVNTSLIIYFLMYLKGGDIGVIKAKVISGLVLLPLFIWITIKQIDFKISSQMLKESFKFSLPVIPSLMAAWFLGQADKIFIAEYFSVHDVGIYSLSRRIAGLVAIISGAFTMTYHPLFFQIVNSQSLVNSTDTLKKYNFSFIIGMAYFCFVVSYLSKDFIFYFLNEKYFNAHIYIPIIVLTFFIGSVSSTILGAFIQQSKKMKADMYISILAVLVTVISYYVLIKPFGINGAIMANLLSTVFLFYLLYIYSLKKCFFIPFNWSKILIVCSILIITHLLTSLILKEVSVLSTTIKVVIAFTFGAFSVKEIHPTILKSLIKK